MPMEHDHSTMTEMAHEDQAVAAEVATTASPNVTMEVNGLVCDFCAQAITKVFKKQDAVENVSVNLTDKRIDVWFKDGQDISNDELTKLINDSGYNIVNINRE